MEPEKSFWKKYEIPILVTATLVLIYIGVIFNQKINFFLGNELIVYLTPNQKSLSMHYGDKNFVELNISIDNFAYCRAACAYSFNDRSKNQPIDQGNFNIGKNEYILKNYELSAQKRGSGQDLYSFDLSCHSIPSLLCLTSKPEKSRSSLIIVNYELSEKEKELKIILRQNLTQLLQGLAELDILQQKVNQKYFELAHKVNLKNLSKEKITIDDQNDKIRISIENLKSIWSAEDYFKLNDLFNGSYLESVENIRKSDEALDKNIDGIVELHNNFLSILDNLFNNFKEAKSFANALEGNELSGVENGLTKFNETVLSITANKFDNYTSLAEEVANLSSRQQALIEKSKIPAADLFFRSDYYLRLEHDNLCSLMGSCANEISINNTLYSTQDFINNYPNPLNFRKNCDSLNELKKEYEIIRNETSSMINDKNISFQSDESFLNISVNFKNNIAREINNSYYGSFSIIRLENKTNSDVEAIAESKLPKNITEIIPSGYIQPVNISLYLLSKINLSSETNSFLDVCSKFNQTQEMINFSLEPIGKNISYKITSTIKTNLSENLPVCCVLNECKPCCTDESCRNDPKTFPVILLHGHSFAKDNSPEFSLDSFNNIQARLQEDGYLNAGTVSLYSKNEGIGAGMWGSFGRPITVKASYYYDAFRKDDKYIVIPTKSENIDTYAVRLKDLIEIVKERTNKPKVNIIAHSMGGLVARRYIQIFNSNDVNKLIMIATPNEGISYSVGNYCGYVGENRECHDMLHDSLFINKLNDPSNQPQNLKMYSIIGQGCRMDSDTGDGIVTVENARLENAKSFYVNGTCSGLFGSVLHTELLNIDKYPETYGIIAEILKE